MHDYVDTAHAVVDEIGIGDRTDMGRKPGIQQIESGDFVRAVLQRSDESFSEMAFVEVSSDGVQFVRFPSAYYGPPVVLAENPMGPPADPQDVVEAGGDAFDLPDQVRSVRQGDAEQVVYCRGHVGGAVRMLGGIRRGIVGRSVHRSAADSRAGEHQRIDPRPMVAAGVAVYFRRAAELGVNN